MISQSPYKKDLSKLQFDRSIELILRNAKNFDFSTEHLGIAAAATMDAGLTMLYAAVKLQDPSTDLDPKDVANAWLYVMSKNFTSIHEAFENNFAQYKEMLRR